MSSEVKGPGGLSAARRKLLSLMLEKKGVKVGPVGAIPRRAESGPCPLSFAQERVWFFEQFEPGTAVYHIANAVRLTGTLNPRALHQSLNEILRRHEVLRTAFTSLEDKPVQIVSTHTELPLPLHELTHLSAEEREREVARLTNAESQRPFDLQRGPLLRCTLLRLAEDEHVAVFIMHHIASDGWSIQVFIAELAALYESFSTGRSATLPELQIQYADFAQWQRGWLQGEVLEEQIAYWKKHLAGAPATLNLATDRPRPPVQTFRGARQALTLGASLSRSLRDLSRQQGVTMFMLLLAGFKALLYRYTGQEDIVVGTPIANRNRTEIEGLIGFFANTLVLRTELSGGQSFVELLKRVREAALGAYAHQDLPFEKLVQELQPERNLGQSPLFQVMFALQNTAGAVVELPGLKLAPVEPDRGTAKFDLFLGMSDEEGGLTLALEYNTDLFDEGTIRSLLRQYGTLLGGVVANPERRLSELPLLTQDERREVLSKWNRTRAEYDRGACVQTRFEQQAARVPDNVAVEFEGRQLSYAELNARANQLAHYLRRRGVGPEVLVGICLERSIEMLVGILGVLKAGGAYVPLDPSYPAERLAFMLEDSRVPVLLLQQPLAQRLPAHAAEVVLMDEGWQAIALESVENLAPSAGADNLAYVIYTSGSTGRPKGGQVSHGALVNFLDSMGREPGLTEDDALLAVTTLSFDIAGLELYLPLIKGARLVLASREMASDGEQLLKKLGGVTMMQATPTTWRLILDAGWERPLPVKALCGGEAFPRELASQLLGRTASLWNMYGPTETTIWSTIHPVERGDGPVPIGRPIANTQIYLLDARLEPVPFGVAGELYIGGDGVARGYLGRPGLTAERFIPDAFGGEIGARLYRTGDLARYRSDGNIEYMGRIDFQVKVHGHRIEPGEIEEVLARHKAVREVVVIAREDQPTDKRLVAYIVENPLGLEEEDGTQGAPLQALGPRLRSYAREKLPEYMVPALYVRLEKMPLTPNGKVDWHALPAPDQTSMATGHAYVAPRTPVEETLAAIWAEVLGVKQVGINDNFFELGGDSILSIQVIARANRAGLRRIPKQLFQHQTIASLAAVADPDAADVPDSRDAEIIKPPLRRLEPDELDRLGAQVEVEAADDAGAGGGISKKIEDAYPLSHAQEGILFHSLYGSEPGVYVLQLSCTFRGLNVAAIERAWQAVIQRHAVLRTAFVWENVTQPMQVVCAEARLPWRRLDWRGLETQAQEERFQSYLEEDVNRGFQLSRAPLMRASLIRVGEDTFKFVWTYHHLLLDGWAIFLILREFFQFYDAYAQGRELELEQPPAYREYIAWLEQQDLASAEEFWRETLKGFTAPTPLGGKSVGVSVRAEAGIEEQRILLPESLATDLQALARQHGLTLNTLVQGAWSLVLSSLGGTKDVVFGVTSAGRPADLPGIESMVGIFINVLPMRAKLTSDEPLWSWLKRLQESHFKLRRYDYSRPVQVQRWSEIQGGLPLFESILSFENFPIDESLQEYTNTLNLSDVRAYSKTNYPATLIVAPRGVLSMRLVYDRQRFDDATATLILEKLSKLLRAFLDQPLARLKEMEDMLARTDQDQRLLEQKKNEAAKRSKFKAIKPRTISLPPELVKTRLHDGQILVIEPALEHVSLSQWAGNKREYLEDELSKYGAVLLRNFEIDSVPKFEAVAAAICPELFGEYGDLPREDVGGKVYGSTPYPASKPILFHNESSHLPRWPMKIWFHCVLAAEQGGETPVVDCRKIYQQLPPSIRERFAQRKLMYVRNFIEGLDVSWQSFFQTTEKAAAEDACRRAGMSYEWLGDNSLRTRQICPAITTHPKTGETVFFNQLQLHHVSCLDPQVRDPLLSMYSREELPRHVYYGDGTPIEDSLVEEICELYREQSVSFPWQPGDILMLDNMLRAHARNPYVGPRRIVVAMGEMFAETKR